MPKVIKNLEDTIVKVSLELFSTLNYDEVDMKHIAKDCGIAVGTLYNYFPNKHDLYISILYNSWRDTIKKLIICKSSAKSHEEAIVKLITILYDDIASRKGLGKFMLTSRKEFDEDARIIKLKKSIEKTLLSFLLDPLDKESYRKTIRLVEVLFINISSLAYSHPREREDNLKFLHTYTLLILNNRNRI